MMSGIEFENRLSGILYGDRERSREEMLDRARYLADLERTVTLKGNKQEIVRAYETFRDRLEDLTYDQSV